MRIDWQYDLYNEEIIATNSVSQASVSQIQAVWHELFSNDLLQYSGELLTISSVPPSIPSEAVWEYFDERLYYGDWLSISVPSSDIEILQVSKRKLKKRKPILFPIRQPIRAIGELRQEAQIIYGSGRLTLTAQSNLKQKKQKLVSVGKINPFADDEILMLLL